ncbi:unnamed protein product, partial [Schistosoma curassoni]|uniref:ENTH domain-containing protein n=1 Tax=Schistosoma curassoni TaxID=6186 RepID=A0A183KUW9_9TREM
KLQEYLVNSRSENGWITKDFIIFDEKYTTNSNHIDYHILKRQESSFKSKVNHDAEHFTYPYYDDPHAKYFNHHHHNCITISSSLPSFTIGIDNWSSFLMYQSTPPPAPTTLPPISVEDEFLDYIVTSDSCDTSEEGDDDDDDGDDNERDDIQSGLVNSSNCSLARTLVKSTSDIVDIDEFINYDEDDDDDEEEEEKRNNLNEDWDHLADLKTEDGLFYKSIRKLSINTKRKNKNLDHNSRLESGHLPYLNRNYIELNSNFNLLEFSIDQLTNMNYSEHKISLNSLQIIMKIITDQCEFRNAFLQYYPILSQKTYAGSYFIKCVDRIIQDDYIPTLQDLLIMKQSSKAVRESLITIGSITLR